MLLRSIVHMQEMFFLNSFLSCLTKLGEDTFSLSDKKIFMVNS